jgi:hypothetical protein
MGQLRTQQLQQQEAGLGIRQKQMDIQSEQAFQRAYLDAGGDPEQAIKLAPGYGVLPKDIFTVRKMLNEAAQAKANLDKTQSENDDMRRDKLHALYQPMFDEKDPNKQAQMAADLGQQAITQGLALPDTVFNYTDSHSAQMYEARLNTEKWLTAQGALLRGKSTQQQADLAQRKETTAENEKDYQQAVSNLAANPPASPLEYRQRLGGYKPSTVVRILGTVPIGSYDSQTSPAMLRQSALTPEQLTQEIGREQKEPSFDAQAVNAAATLWAKQNNVVLDPRKPWQAQVPPEAAPQILSAAKRYAETPDTQATRALAQEMTRARLDDLRQNQAAAGSYVQQMMQNPDIFHELSPQEKARVAPAWTQATGLPVPLKLSSQTQQANDSSQIALGRVDAIREALNDPAIRSRIGAFLGRLGQGEMAAGATLGLTDDQARKAQDLRSSMTYLLFGEGKAILGGRIPQQLMQELEKTSPRVSESMPMIQGSLDAVERTAKNNIFTAEQLRFGGKTRPGFTPGFKAQGAGNAVPALPARLGPSDVGKIYISPKTGKKLKIIDVNPQNPTQFHSQEIQ